MHRSDLEMMRDRMWSCIIHWYEVA